MPVIGCSPYDTWSALPERMWQAVVDQAIAWSRCAGAGTECNIQIVWHPGDWAIVRHVGSTPHVCRTCEIGRNSEHLVSGYTLRHTDRRALARTLASFLDHFHEDHDPAAVTSGAADGAGLGDWAAPSGCC